MVIAYHLLKAGRCPALSFEAPSRVWDRSRGSVVLFGCIGGTARIWERRSAAVGSSRHRYGFLEFVLALQAHVVRVRLRVA